jgi:hypothetical protein
MHRHHPQRASLYLALVSGATAVSMAIWGLYVLGGN